MGLYHTCLTDRKTSMVHPMTSSLAAPQRVQLLLHTSRANDGLKIGIYFLQAGTTADTAQELDRAATRALVLQAGHMLAWVRHNHVLPWRAVMHGQAVAVHFDMLSNWSCTAEREEEAICSTRASIISCAEMTTVPVGIQWS